MHSSPRSELQQIAALQRQVDYLEKQIRVLMLAVGHGHDHPPPRPYDEPLAEPPTEDGFEKNIPHSSGASGLWDDLEFGSKPQADTPAQHKQSNPLLALSPTPKLSLHSYNGPFASLSPRQHAIAQMLSEGLSARDIAERMGTSVNTEKTLIRRLNLKFGVSSVNELRLQLKAIFSTISQDDYAALSGGLPLTWSSRYQEPDPYRPIYHAD
ncbi:helix-turn-helix domain-containing protein [Neptuniibacter sp. QD37_11]|uniref:helix-turn-helix domain-containing protein n=1 Tax=Neptuniibacter sp. QD37_11 TaxID=3398209 RepID=UPI0039F5C753